MHDVGVDKKLEKSALALLTDCYGSKFRLSERSGKDEEKCGG